MFKKLENFWYHYKWHTIIALFFVVVIVFCSVQMATKENYDAYVSFIGNSSKISQTDYYDIISSLESVSDDYNKDKKTSVCFNRELFLSDGEDVFTSGINSNVTTFMQSYLYSDCYLFIIDPILYESYKDSGMFISIKEYAGSCSEALNDERSIRIGDIEFFNKLGINSMPEDYLLVLKTVPYVNSKRKTELMTEQQANHIEMLKNITKMGMRNYVITES